MNVCGRFKNKSVQISQTNGARQVWGEKKIQNFSHIHHEFESTHGKYLRANDDRMKSITKGKTTL